MTRTRLDPPIVQRLSDIDASQKGFPLRVEYQYETQDPDCIDRSNNLQRIPAVISSEHDKIKNEKKLINTNTQFINDGFYKYVIKDKDDQLLLGEKLSGDDINLSLKEARTQNDWSRTATYKHSYLAAFKPVKYAGYIKIKDGKIDDIDLYSGHYCVPKALGFLLIDKFKHLFSDSFLGKLESGNSDLFLQPFYNDWVDKIERDDETEAYCKTDQLDRLDKKLKYLDDLSIIYENLNDIEAINARYKTALSQFRNSIKTAKKNSISRYNVPTPPQELRDLKIQVDSLKEAKEVNEKLLSEYRQSNYYNEIFKNNDVTLEMINNIYIELRHKRDALYHEFLLDK